ncbi:MULTISPECIES: hypothetical protein [unclassified Solwaraspora]|uniref:hypothetical protein n=1 Tax=unclassified Solwaraspora TaxID=2627926 RepID=UPI00248BF7B3|nr:MULTISPECIES: hypothetical protein [unclassified Solwaraspora]WBB94980.1 hypothetical protein O7553_16255 [Solwaraspora sp. WMMA2059]WBC21137.1 hypothetical protein O7543_01120 [Solwaraspora sp. WMMA2080]WJK36780.1 hypothetical protein O7610_10765 [Solwaraspora sp. WMMA2065]
MNVEKRDRSGQVGQRGARVGALRSGGRTAARRSNPSGGYATQGSAALQEQPTTQDSVRVWDSSAEPAPPRLRVAPPAPVSVPRAPFIAMILVVVVGGVLGVLLVNTKINENAVRIGTLQQQQSNLDLQEQQLEKEIAQYEAPNNLAAQARKLGLVESGPPAFIRLPDGRIIGVPQPATGEPAITSSQQGAGE